MQQSKTYLAPLGSGIGDVIVALPVLRHLIDSGAQVVMVARGPRQLGFDQRIEGLLGVVREVDLQSILMPEDTYINLRDHPIQTSYDWFGEKFARDYPGYLVNNILNEICQSHGLSVDFSKMEKLPATILPELAGSVAFVPGTTIDFKSWPVASWLKLSALLKEQGLPIVMFGEPERSEVVAELLAQGITWHPTASIGDAIDAVSSVAGMVAVDTGLMHIAVQQGIPTVALMNYVHTYHRPAGNCRPLLGNRCAPECRFEVVGEEIYAATFPQWVWYAGEFKHCKAEAPCMTAIHPEQVLSSLQDVLTNEQALYS